LKIPQPHHGESIGEKTQKPERERTTKHPFDLGHFSRKHLFLHRQKIDNSIDSMSSFPLVPERLWSCSILPSILLNMAYHWSVDRTWAFVFLLFFSEQFCKTPESLAKQ